MRSFGAIWPVLAGVFVFAGGIRAAKEPEVQNASVDSIIQKSVEANERDWRADPEYDYTETTSTGKGSKTYKVTMLFGSPYEQLIAVNGKPLSPEEQRQEQQKFDQAVVARRNESRAEAQRRIAKYERSRRRDHVMIQQLSKAFNFQLKGKSTLNGREVYVLAASPKPGYQPPNTDARVLTGMRGTLWIDTASYQWVKVEAQVMRPVSIEGFLARVEPGTFFELEKMPVGQDIWLPKHFEMKAHAKVLGVFNHNNQETDDFSNYHRTPAQYQKKAGQ